MDWLTMHRVVEELGPSVDGGQIQKVRQSDTSTLCLSIRNPGQTTHLILSARSQYARITASPSPTDTLPSPTGLGMWVRKHGKGRRIGRLSLNESDRIITLPISGGRIILEIFGHAGLICALDEEGILRAAAGVMRPQLQLGDPYRPPEAPEDLKRTSERIFQGAQALESQYHERILAQTKQQDIQAIRRLLNGAEKKLRRLKNKIQGDLDRCADAEEHRIHGELLKGQLFRVVPGASSVVVDDWFAEGTPKRTIPLDPRLDGPGHIEDFFRRYKRGRDGVHKAQERMDLVDKRITALAQLASESLTIDVLKQRLQTLKLWAPQRQGQRRNDAPRSPYFVFQSQQGETIWVGRGGADNHATTFHHARGNDHWLHTKDVPGAHVIVPCRQRGRPPHQETLLDAAALAIHHSRLRNEDNVAVTHTERKHVRPVKGGPPGLVTIAAGKTITPHDTAIRIARLYGQRPV